MTGGGKAAGGKGSALHEFQQKLCVCMSVYTFEAWTMGSSECKNKCFYVSHRRNACNVKDLEHCM